MGSCHFSIGLLCKHVLPDGYGVSFFFFATQVLWVGAGGEVGSADFVLYTWEDAKFGYTMHAHVCCLAVGHPGGICHVTWSSVACVGVLTLTFRVLVIILHA